MVSEGPMRILQILTPAASEFEKKCQRVDFAAFSAKHEVVVLDYSVSGAATRDRSLSPSGVTANAPQITHVYGRPDGVELPTPYVASFPVPRRRFALRQSKQPSAIVSPFEVPEAVEDRYFDAQRPSDAAPQRPASTIASFDRKSIRNIVEQTVARIHRFRDDVTWQLFERAPAPADLAGVDAWIDPAIDENDFDGFVAEAIAAGVPVVASRIAINEQRLEKGRTGFLVPRNDPNEHTHAILAALFKPEVARSKFEAARQTAGKFRPRQRSRVLERIYETVIR
jgi:Glycosyl transferases group 1